MSNNILIFRTDRIGDLIYTCPSVLTIKDNLIKSNITLVCSNKNYEYAKNLNIFDEIIVFPTRNFLSKIKFINVLRKRYFDYIFVFDGKERSIITSILIKSKYKVSLSSKIKFYYKIFNINFFKDYNNKNLYETFQEMLTYCKINTKISNYDFINKKVDNKFSSNILIRDYVHIHLDEKWINSLYIKTYTDINPSYRSFVDFIETLNKEKNLLITTGIKSFDLIEKLKNNYFLKKNEQIFYKNNSKHSIYMIYKPTFEDLESLLRNAKFLISCHGALTHASNCFKIKKIDILEKGRKDFYIKYTSYLNNYCLIYRSNFDLLKKDIYKELLPFD